MKKLTSILLFTASFAFGQQIDTRLYNDTSYDSINTNRRQKITVLLDTTYEVIEDEPTHPYKRIKSKVISVTGPNRNLTYINGSCTGFGRPSPPFKLDPTPSEPFTILDTVRCSQIIYSENEFLKVGSGSITRSRIVTSESKYWFNSDVKTEKIVLDNGKVISVLDVIQFNCK